MKIRRTTAALVAVAMTVPVVLANLNSASATSTWSFYKLPGAAGGTEPGIDIGVDADGNELVYVHTTHGIPSHNRMWIRQPDLPEFNPPALNQSIGFKQITFTNPYNRLPGGGDADVAYRGDDVWFIDLWLGSNSIAYSPDKGATWVQGTPVTSLPLSDRQWIALGPTVPHLITGEPQTTVYVTYQTVQPDGSAWVSRSRDNGLTWDFHRQIGAAGIPAHIVTDGDKMVSIGVISGGTFRVAVSHDEGQSFSVSTPATGTIGLLNGFTKNYRDNTNQMAVVYPFGNNAPDGLPSNKVGVKLSHDSGATWSAPIRLEPDAPLLGPVDVFPWVDWRGDKIAVAWYQSTEMIPGRNPNNADSDDRWHVWYAESLDNGATWSAPEQVGTWAAKHGNICTTGLSCSGGRELGDFMQLAIDQHGNSWISMVHVNGGPLGGGVYIYKQNPPLPEEG